MSVTGEILRTYRAPRAVVRGLLRAVATDTKPEARALSFLLAGCFVIFVAQVPGLLAADLAAPDAPPREALIGITFFMWMVVWPLIFYLLAALGHLLARVAGGQGSFARARTAMCWTVLAVSPLMLLRAAVEALAGDGLPLQIVNGGLVLAFLALWVISLIEAERPLTS